MNLLERYPAYDGWVRNYKAMKDDKLVECIIDFKASERSEWAIGTPAVKRVIDHGGDILDNYAACRAECDRRGIREVV